MNEANGAESKAVRPTGRTTNGELKGKRRRFGYKRQWFEQSWKYIAGLENSLVVVDQSTERSLSRLRNPHEKNSSIEYPEDQNNYLGIPAM